MKRLVIIWLLAMPFVLCAQKFKVVDINARHHLFKGVNEKLFNAAIKGEITAYNGAMEVISPEGIKESGKRKTIVAVYPDPGDPYYYYDSTVVEDFSPENIDGYIFMTDTVAAADSLTSDTPNAIGIYYNIKERGPDEEVIKLRQDIFWLKWEEALPLLNQAEHKYLVNLYKIQEGVER